MKDMKVTESILYVGCNDRDIDLFESQYHVPNGVSYNSYVMRRSPSWIPQTRE
jgi:flavorubredoxin